MIGAKDRRYFLVKRSPGLINGVSGTASGLYITTYVVTLGLTRGQHTPQVYITPQLNACQGVYIRPHHGHVRPQQLDRVSIETYTRIYQQQVTLPIWGRSLFVGKQHVTILVLTYIYI